VGIYGPQSVFRIVWDGRKQFKRLGDRTGMIGDKLSVTVLISKVNLSCFLTNPYIMMIRINNVKIIYNL
jgi:hypothetical protein